MAQGAEEFQGGDVSGSDGNYQFFSYLVPDASRCGSIESRTDDHNVNLDG